MSHRFQIDFITHDDYEYLAVEISFRGQRVCQLFRNKSDDRIDIEIVEDRLVLDPPPQLRFPLDEFMDVVAEARKELLALKF